MQRTRDRTAVPRAWSEDPLEVDRYLDGELDACEYAQRAQDVAARPHLAARIAARTAYLAALRAAAAPADPTWVAGATARLRASGFGQGARAPTGAAGRRARAWGAGMGRPGFRWGAAAAAVLAAVFLLAAERGPADAAPSPSERAVALLRHHSGGAVQPTPGACADGDRRSPWRFPLVVSEELKVGGCAEEGPAEDRTEAVLIRSDDLVAYVADPAPAAGGTPGGVGVLTLPDVVVFDLEHQGTRYHLAVARRVIERSGTCAGCHGAERRRGDSPHRFIDRPRP